MPLRKDTSRKNLPGFKMDQPVISHDEDRHITKSPQYSTDKTLHKRMKNRVTGLATAGKKKKPK